MSERSLRDFHARGELIARLDRLMPEQSPLWGEMSPARVLPHAAYAMRLAFMAGEVPTADADAPFAGKRREWIQKWSWPECNANLRPRD